MYLPPDPKEGRVESEDTPVTNQQRSLIDSSGALTLIGKQLYDDTRDRVEIINNLADEIEGTENVKSSLDLMNTQIAALHSTLEKLLTLQALMAKRAAIVDMGTVNENRSQTDFMQW